MPKISVIVPVYKAEAYLADCIDSILSQTFSDLEVILVDDGSPDNCYAVCQDYARKDSRVRVLRQENRGQAAARNHAMTLAAGEWICFVDSDDLIHPQMLELLYEAAVESGAGISMCQFVEAPQLPDDFLRRREPVFQLQSMEEENLLRLYDQDEYPGWVACTKLIRREIVESYPFTEGRVFEDNEAVCRWICQAKLLAGTEEALYYYRTNEGSTTKSDFSLKKLDYLWALESITRFYGSLGYDQMKQRFADRYVDAAVESCYGARHMLSRPDVAKTIDKQARNFLRTENLQLSQAQFEALLDAAHPTLIRLYWPLSGIARTLRSGGISGLLQKAAGKLRKGDSQ